MVRNVGTHKCNYCYGRRTQGLFGSFPNTAKTRRTFDASLQSAFALFSEFWRCLSLSACMQAIFRPKHAKCVAAHLVAQLSARPHAVPRRHSNRQLQTRRVSVMSHNVKVKNLQRPPDIKTKVQSPKVFIYSYLKFSPRPSNKEMD